MPENLSQLASRVRQRERWSRADVVARARRAGFDISDSYIRSIEKGLTKSPTLEKLRALAAGLGVSFDDVLRVSGLTTAEAAKLFEDGEHYGDADHNKQKPGNHHTFMLSASSPPKTKAQHGVKDSQDLQDLFSIPGSMPIAGLVILPVYGAVSCGEPSWLPDRAVGYVSVPDFMVNGAEAAVAVRGTSMVGCGFDEGDLLTVRRLDGERPTNGKKVIACIDGEYTCAVYRSEEIGEYLEKWYGNEPPKRFPIKGETRLHAVVVGSLRRE